LSERIDLRLIAISPLATQNAFVTLPDIFWRCRFPQGNDTIEGDITVFETGVLVFLECPVFLALHLNQNTRVKDAHDFVLLYLLYFRESKFLNQNVIKI
jgi:hypothetical protein